VQTRPSEFAQQAADRLWRGLAGRTHLGDALIQTFKFAHVLFLLNRWGTQAKMRGALVANFVDALSRPVCG
jgi:hypothetical protein